MALQYFAVMGDYCEWHKVLFTSTENFSSVNDLIIANQFLDDQIRTRLEAARVKSFAGDMISDFVPYAISDPDPDKTYGSLRNLCETNIFPGADTTATAICSTLHFLSQNPAMLDRLRQDLQFFREGDHEQQLDGGQKYAPYLQAVVEEAMRLHPPVGLMNPRVIPEGGITICGRYFNGGVSPTGFPNLVLADTRLQSVAGVNAFALHYNPEVWGSDYNSFRPERWLVGEDERRRMKRSLMTVRLCQTPCFMNWHADNQKVGSR